MSHLGQPEVFVPTLTVETKGRMWGLAVTSGVVADKSGREYGEERDLS